MNTHDTHNTQVPGYRVEVSGWDELENFFVETALLHWDGSGRQQLNTRSRLRQDSVVFVRLLHPTESQENFPMPYVAARLLTIEMDGRSNMLITRLHPKPAFRQAAEALPGNSVQVA